MLNLFFISASCRIRWYWSHSSDDFNKWPNYAPYSNNFDLKYTVEGEEERSTTYNDRGWKVDLRYPAGDERNESRYPVLGDNDGKLENDSIPLKVTTEFDQSLNENFIRVIFKVENIGSNVERFDLAAYSDISLGGDDKATVNPLLGLSGLTMISGEFSRGDAITLLAKEYFGVTTVDYFWYGEPDTEHDAFQIGRNLTEEKPLEYSDSAFELGWLNRSINPQEIQTFNVLLAIGRKIRLPPQVIGLKDKHVCEAGQSCQIPVRYSSLYPDVELELYSQVEEGSDPIINSFTTSAETKSKDFNVTVNPNGNAREMTVKIYAKDRETTLDSEKYTATVIFNQRPTLTINNEPNGPIYWGDKIEFPVTIADDTQAKVVYVFNGQNHEGELISTGSSSTITPENPKAGETVTVMGCVKNPLKRQYKVRTVINGQTFEKEIPATENGQCSAVSYEVKLPDDDKEAQDIKISVINSRGETVKEFDKKVTIAPKDPPTQPEKQDPPTQPEKSKTEEDKLAAQKEEEERLRKLKQEEEEKKKNLIGIIVGSVAAGLALVGGITYYLLGPAKKRKAEEEEDETENYIEDLEMSEHIAKEVADVNNNIFPVNIENPSDGDALDFVTQDPIEP